MPFSSSLLVATRNSHKTQEIQSMLGATFPVRDLTTGSFPEVEETGSTFLENAALKAEEISNTTIDLVLSDDSGLEVDALSGAPGVYSARYAGEDASDSDNITKLHHELSKLNLDKPVSARFKCVMVIAKDGEKLASFEGAVEGVIIDQLRGDNGFGYDPVFVPNGYDKTFAELGNSVKNKLSHRAQALKQAMEWLENVTNS